MSDDPRYLALENALLRAVLWLTARRPQDYHDAPHVELDDNGRPMLEARVDPPLRGKAAEVLANAQNMLKDEGRGRG